MTCHSRILREFKKAKWDSVEYQHVEFRPDVHDKPVCGGTLTLSVGAVVDGECCCSGSAEIFVGIECDRCKHGSFPGSENLTHASQSRVCETLAKYATGGLEVEERGELIETELARVVPQDRD